MGLIIKGDTVTGYESKTRGDDVVIPEGVKAIDNEAFLLGRDAGFCRSFTFPDSIERIGIRAFLGLTSMEWISLPDKPVAVSEMAFYGVEGLKEIRIRRSGETLSLPVNLDRCDHNERHYFVKMIAERNYSVKLQADFKNPTIARMCLAGIDSAEDYVKRGFTRLFKAMCCGLTDDTDRELLTALIKTGKFVNKKNAAKLIEHAEDVGETAIAELVREYCG